MVYSYKAQVLDGLPEKFFPTKETEKFFAKVFQKFSNYKEIEKVSEKFFQK